MTTKLLSYIVMLLLIGFVTASCEVQPQYSPREDYCLNISIDHPDSTNNVYFSLGGDYGKNSLSKDYVDTNLQNVYFEIVNTTDADGAKFGFDSIAAISSIGNPLRYGAILRCMSCTAPCSSQATSHLIVCLNGTRDFNYNTSSRQGGVNYNSTPQTVTLTDFTKLYTRNWTFRDETTNQLYNFTGSNSTLKTWCDAYSEFSINLTDKIGDGGSIIVQTKETPKFFATVNSQIERVRQDPQQRLYDNYYLTTSHTDPYTLTLQDFTGGQFWGSTLKIYKSINDTLGIVHSEQFPIDGIVTPSLINNTQYKFVVVGDTSTRDLGGIFIRDDNTVRNIIVTQPDFSQYLNTWRGLTISLTQDYDTSTVGCTMNSTLTENVVFTVKNITSDEYVYDYNVTGDGTNVVLSYTITDNNGSYYLCCSAHNSVEGIRSLCQVVNVRDLDAIQYGFDLNLPERVLGVSRATVYKLVSIAILVIVAGIFSQQSYGTGSLVTASCLSFFYYIGWFPIPQIMVAFIWTLAIFTKISEGRKGVPT